MLAKVFSGATVGLESVPVEVEVDIQKKGLPAFKIVGLPDKAVEEARERVRSALINSGATFPNYKITVNLAPANLPKEGPAYDLPIALGILIASGQIAVANYENAVVLGELSLDGSVRHVKGVLPLVLMAREHGFRNIFVPEMDAEEAAVVKGIDIYPVSTLVQIFYHYKHIEKIEPRKSLDLEKVIANHPTYECDFAHIRGQESAKRALKIAAAGNHNVLFKGPPGAGKTLLARSLPSILPKLTTSEALEVTKIYSVAGRLPTAEPLITKRPFRSPHHTVSRVGLIGGGTIPAPGEISLAHRGVLFLDEFPEFPRHVLESLRQPLEDGVVTISRARATSTYPAEFLLVAAQNPCPCGFYGTTEKQCTCSPREIRKYQKKISGPLLDRIDLHVTVPRVKTEKLFDPEAADAKSSADVQSHVQEARNRQLARFKDTKVRANAEIPAKAVEEFCALQGSVRKYLRGIVSKYSLSARAYHKVLKISRTIADLENEEEISKAHVSEAVTYRMRDNA
ncbi:MAG: YifB family Mg chelatase-like AAA ATPase [Patescibacteria group bacterium]